MSGSSADEGREGERRREEFQEEVPPQVVADRFLLEIDDGHGEQASKKLWLAIKSGDLVAAQKAIQNGADVQHVSSDSINFFGFSVLGKAIDVCHFEFVPLLLLHGANIDCRDRLQRTPLMGASTAGSLSCRGSQGAANVVKLLVHCGADIEAQDYEGSTTLHLAVHYNVVSAVEYLILSGADLSVVDNSGRTPLHRALQALPCDPLRMISLLLSYGSDPHIVDKSGQSSLDYAFATWNIPPQTVTQFVQSQHRKRETLQLLCIRKLRKLFSGGTTTPPKMVKNIEMDALFLPSDLREKLGLCSIEEVVEDFTFRDMMARFKRCEVGGGTKIV